MPSVPGPRPALLLLNRASPVTSEGPAGGSDLDDLEQLRGRFPPRGEGGQRQPCARVAGSRRAEGRGALLPTGSARCEPGALHRAGGSRPRTRPQAELPGPARTRVAPRPRGSCSQNALGAEPGVAASCTEPPWAGLCHPCLVPSPGRLWSKSWGHYL